MRQQYFSVKYKLIRFITKIIAYSAQFITRKPRDLETVVNVGKASISLL